MSSRTAYADAGVDVAAGDRAVELMRARLPVAGGDLLGGIGGFAAVLELPSGMTKPVLVTGTDGVGTKTEIARRLGRYDTIGEDLVAMCADDIVCHGARAMYFLDYVAVGRVDPLHAAEIVAGVSRACTSIGCALVGGETAEHPGLMEDDAFDLAGFCIGFVERSELIDGSGARAGDAVIGLASSGLHANGYSLIRALLERGVLPLDDSLLTPTRIYSAAILELLSAMRAGGARVGGLAHITGGGLAGNLPRAVPDGLGVILDPQAWPEPEIFSRVRVAAGIEDVEMRATFNCGIGFAVVLEPDAVATALESLAEQGVEAWRIGEIRKADRAEQRYLEAA